MMTNPISCGPVVVAKCKIKLPRYQYFDLRGL